MKPTGQFRKLRTGVCLLALYSVLPFTAAASSLQEELREILSDGRLENASVAVHVAGTGDGEEEVLFSKNADRPLIPASNQKIVTAIAALDVLGEDYEFTTTLWTDGEVEGGVLSGDLWIAGGGDPTIGSPAIGEDAAAQFERWARWLRDESGISRVSGDIVVDESMFDQMYVHPDWPVNQLHRRHSAPVGALSFQDNCVRLDVRPAEAVGMPARVGVYPPLDLFRIDNTCVTDAGSNIIRVDWGQGEWEIRVGGRARLGTGGWSGLVSVPDPALFAGETFGYILARHGITFDGVVRRGGRGEYGSEGMMLQGRRRASLAQVLKVMLVESQNFYAESVTKAIGAHSRGLGSWENGLEATGAVLSARGWDRSDFALADGSGYSRNNRITGRMLCGLLIQMHEGSGAVGFPELLPLGGEEGTLSNRFRGSAYRGRVRAKSGYISRVGTLSGYAEAASGRVIVFSIMINDFGRGSNWDMRQIQDAIVEAIIDNA